MKNLPIVLRRNRMKDALYLFGCAVFVALGFYVLEKSIVKGSIAIVFFGLLAIGFAIQLISDVSYLKLTTEGFEVKTLLNRRTYVWSDIKNLRKGSFKGIQSIYFDFTTDYLEEQHNSGLFKQRRGGFQSSYSMNSDELLRLMKNLRRGGNRS